MKPAAVVMKAVGVWLKGVFGVLLLFVLVAPLTAAVLGIQHLIETNDIRTLLWLFWILLGPLVAYPVGKDAWDYLRGNDE